MDTKEEYEKCLEYYQQMLVEEERHSNEALNHLDDFADVIGELVFRDSSSMHPEMQEFEF